MSANERGCSRRRPQDWLPQSHLARFVLAAVEEMDLTGFYAAYRGDGVGHPAHDPGVMVALLLYAYASGQRSSPRICGGKHQRNAESSKAGNVAISAVDRASTPATQQVLDLEATVPFRVVSTRCRLLPNTPPRVDG
jgi:hypothetical protein